MIKDVFLTTLEAHILEKGRGHSFIQFQFFFISFILESTYYDINFHNVFNI